MQTGENYQYATVKKTGQRGLKQTDKFFPSTKKIYLMLIREYELASSPETKPRAEEK